MLVGARHNFLFHFDITQSYHHSLIHRQRHYIINYTFNCTVFYSPSVQVNDINVFLFPFFLFRSTILRIVMLFSRSKLKAHALPIENTEHATITIDFDLCSRREGKCPRRRMFTNDKAITLRIKCQVTKDDIHLQNRQTAE